MKLSELFGSTLRTAPADAETVSYQWLARAGYIRATKSGAFAKLPLAARALNKLKTKIRYELEARGGQEIGSHVDVEQLASVGVQSYRDLPKTLFADDEVMQDAHPRLGLFGAPYSPGVDIHVLADSEETQEHYKKVIAEMLDDFFEKLTIDVKETDEGGYAFLMEKGGTDYVRCPECGYFARQAVARRGKTALPAEEAQELEKVATPDAYTIDALTSFLNIPKEKTAKAVFMMATVDGEEKLVFAILRGDMALSEEKLTAALAASNLRVATDREIEAVGAVPGYASPVRLKNVLIVVDDLIPDSANLVAGANEMGYHFQNVNLRRDYKADVVADIALAEVDDPCPKCNAKLAVVEGVPLVLPSPAHAAAEVTYADDQGKGQPIWLASWTLDLGRMLAAVAESHHDDYGLILPPAAAPYDVHLVWLPSKKVDTRADADEIYLNLTGKGFAVLYDDRDARAGEKFNDADLIGCPVRITVGAKALAEECVEIKMRNKKEKELIALDEVANYVLENLD